MPVLAPYNSWMRRGSGFVEYCSLIQNSRLTCCSFNSYTQELCIQDAVLIESGDAVTKPDTRRTDATSHSRVPRGRSDSHRTGVDGSISVPLHDEHAGAPSAATPTSNTAPNNATRKGVPPARTSSPNRNVNQIVTYS